MPASSSSRKRKHSAPEFALLYGDDVYAQGTESAMKRMKRQARDYATEERPLRIVRSSLLKKRSRDEVVDLAAEEDLREKAKRLRLDQDAAYEKCLAEDQRASEEQNKVLENERWKKRYEEPEKRAARFDELFKKKNSRFTACLLRQRV